MDVASLAIKVDSTQIEKAEKGLKKLSDQGRKTERATDKIESSFKKIGAAAKIMAVGVAAVGASLYVVGKAMTANIALAKIQEKSEMKLAAVLKATGGAAGYNAEELYAMAGAMQAVTTVGDEVIIGGMSILATFKNIRGEAFERTTKAALDMSTVMGVSLSSAMVQLGKAINDPAVGLSMLTRVGITFNDQQKEQIKTLQASGDLMGAQALILAELESQFGNVAAAMRNSFEGATKSSANAFGDLQEEMGFWITKSPAMIKAAQDSEQMFIKWTAALKENRGAIIGVVDAVVEGAADVVSGIGLFMRTVSNAKELIEGEDGLFVRILFGATPVGVIVGHVKYVYGVVEKVTGLIKGKLVEVNEAMEETFDTQIAFISGDRWMKEAEISVAGTQKIIEILKVEKWETLEIDKAVEKLRVTRLKADQEAVASGANVVKILRDVKWETLEIDKAVEKVRVEKLAEEFEKTTDRIDSALEDFFGDLDEKSKTATDNMQTQWFDMGDAVENSMVNVIGGAIRKEITSLGEAWDVFTSSMVASFLAAGARMAASKFASFLFGEESGSSGKSSGGGLIGSAISGVSKFVGGLFAQGGVPGGAGLGAYRNQIVSQPTIFPFASGGVPSAGLMGEAGDEGILPLATMPSGNLGVEAIIPNSKSGDDRAVKDQTKAVERSTEQVKEQTDVAQESISVTQDHSKAVQAATVSTQAATVSTNTVAPAVDRFSAATTAVMGWVSDAKDTAVAAAKSATASAKSLSGWQWGGVAVASAISPYLGGLAAKGFASRNASINEGIATLDTIGSVSGGGGFYSQPGSISSTGMSANGSSSDSGGYDSPSGRGESEPGADRYAKGGLVDSLRVPRGEHGWAAMRLGEGVVSQTGMRNLDKINSGSFGSQRELVSVMSDVARLLLKNNMIVGKNTKKTASLLQRFATNGIPIQA